MNNRYTNQQQEERDFMEFIDKFSAFIQQPKVYILNKEKEEKMYEVQRKMQELLDEEAIEAKVEIRPCPMGMGDAIIQFRADSFIARNIPEFLKIAKEFSNFEIYPVGDEIQFAGIITQVAKIIY